MQINHNISALIANAHLKRTNNALDKSLEKLSSGLRINHAADDAAGMAISQKMKTQIAGLEQASRNASDGISVIQTAEGALGEVQAMLQRARELSVQAANGTNTVEDKQAIQEEIDQLMTEIDRISTDTEFNTKPLLDGSVGRKSYSSNTNVKLISVSDAVDPKKYTIKEITVGKSAKIQADNVIDIGTVKDDVTGIEVPGIAVEGSVVINGETVEINKGDTKDEIMEKLRTVCEYSNIELSEKEGRLNFKTLEAGVDQKIVIHCESDELAKKLGINSLTDVTNSTDPFGLGKTAIGKDAVVTIDKGENADFSATTTVVADGNIVKITDSDGFEMKIAINGTKKDENGKEVEIKQPITNVTLSVLDAGPMLIQIGANEGQTVELNIAEVSSETLGLAHLNVLTQDGASEAITMLDEAINMVSGVRSKLGAYQNRLEHAVANLDTSAQNLTEALSRIEDVDMAEEMANYTQKNVLSQAGVSMVSQANERPQNILSLLQ